MTARQVTYRPCLSGENAIRQQKRAAEATLIFAIAAVPAMKMPPLRVGLWGKRK
jgi:hypothetical protein